MSSLRHVLVIKADRFYAHAIRQELTVALPDSQIHVAPRVAEAAEFLAETPVELLVTGVEMVDGDVLELLADCTHEPRRVRRVLVVTGRREPHVIASLVALRVDGIFDSGSEEPEQFQAAVAMIVSGGTFFSASFSALRKAPDSRLRLLTRTQRLVFAVIGDGCANAAAAVRLGMAESTVKSHRRDIHRILGVQHKGELISAAEELGFVATTAEGTIRPGLSTMLAARQQRRRIRLLDLASAPQPSAAG